MEELIITGSYHQILEKNYIWSHMSFDDSMRTHITYTTFYRVLLLIITVILQYYCDNLRFR